LVIKKPGKRVEALFPELAGVVEPVRRLLHGIRGQGAAHDPARLLAPDEPCVLEDAQVFHETRQRHGKGARELGDRAASGGKHLHHLAARRVGERGENRVEWLV